MVRRTADEIVRIATEGGHRLSLEYREPPAEFADVPPKWWCSCSCGWSTTARRAKVAATSSGGNHLAKMAAEIVEDRAAEERRRRVAARLPGSVGPVS